MVTRPPTEDLVYTLKIVDEVTNLFTRLHSATPILTTTPIIQNSYFVKTRIVVLESLFDYMYNESLKWQLILLTKSQLAIIIKFMVSLTS